jgi:uncharacterized membrane protein
MKVLTRAEWAILAAIIIYSFIPTFGGLIRVLELAGGPAIAPENLRALAAPVPIILHILSSFLFCIVGAIQFLPSIRRHHPAIHRCFGRLVWAAGCISAGSGLWMTHFYSFPADLQGNLLYWVRIMLGCLMIGFIARAVTAIRSQNIFGHSAAMLRAYAIGQGASTQTFLGIGWMIISGTELLGPIRDNVMVLAWALNLMVAELVIRKFQIRKSVLTSKPSAIYQ